MSEWNFAGRLVKRLGAKSDLIDAATAQTLPAADVPSLIVGFAAGFLSVGLRPGNRVLISCGVDPLSALAYIGAMYAGCVPVLVIKVHRGTQSLYSRYRMDVLMLFT